LCDDALAHAKRLVPVGRDSPAPSRQDEREKRWSEVCISEICIRWTYDGVDTDSRESASETPALQERTDRSAETPFDGHFGKSELIETGRIAECRRRIIRQPGERTTK
jgi:hypothetical protein